MVEKWNSVGGTVWWNSFSGTVMLEQCRWNSDGATLRWNSVRERVDQWNSENGTVEDGR